MNKKEILNEIEKIRDIINKGIKAQLMRGDRSEKQCWQVSLRGIEKANEACLELEEKIKSADLLYNVD